MRLLPFTFILLTLVPSVRAQSAAAPGPCPRAVPGQPTLPVITPTRPVAGAGPAWHLPTQPTRLASGIGLRGAPCAGATRGGNDPLALVLQEAWTGADWAPLTRDRYAYDGDARLTESATDVWDGAAWAPDARDTWAYDGAGRVVEYGRTYWVGPDPINDFRELFAYDVAGLVAEYVYQVGTPAGWENNGRALPAYDAAGNPVEVLTQQWTGADWADFAVQTYAYDAAGRLTEETRADWDGAAFVPVAREFRSYDAATGALVRWRFQAWDGAAWADTGRETYTVDAAGRTVEHRGETVEGGAFVNLLRDRFAYLVADGTELVYAESRTWDAAAGDWGYGFRETTAYDEARRALSYTYESVDGPGVAWRGVFRELYTIDAGGRRTERVVQGGTETGWQNESQTLYAFDAEGRALEDLERAWDGSTWVQARRLRYGYADATASEPGAPAAAVTLRAFPNPARGAATLTFTLVAPGAATVEVFDARGRRVATVADGVYAAGTHRLVWRANALAPGVYTVRLRAGARVAVQTVTVVR